MRTYSAARMGRLDATSDGLGGKVRPTKFASDSDEAAPLSALANRDGMTGNATRQSTYARGAGMSFPKMGNTFRNGSGRPQERGPSTEAANFAVAIAGALRRELEFSHSALKIAAAWTGTNERTVKNWLAGRSGPSGHHLGQLARHSDEVFCAFLMFAGRDELLLATKLLSTRNQLHDLLRQVDVLIMNAGSDPGD